MHWSVFYLLFLTNPVVTKELVNFILRPYLNVNSNMEKKEQLADLNPKSSN